MKSRYLLGVSAVALVVAMTPAKADEILSSDPGGAYIDFPVSGNVINPLGANQGFSGSRADIGIEVYDATVTGDVINRGSIYATDVGISVDGDDYGYAAGVVNEGRLDVLNDDTDDANATGILHWAEGPGAVTVRGSNSGNIYVTAEATDSETGDDGPSDYAEATAYATGVDQGAYSWEDGTASVSFGNSGTIKVLSTAEANGATGVDNPWGGADADAFAYGIIQDVESSDGDAEAYVNNAAGAFIEVTAKAEAYSEGTDVGSASASVTAIGVWQELDAEYGRATARVVNAGSIDVEATAEAYGADEAADADADASVEVTGILQDLQDNDVDVGLAEVTNSGRIEVQGVARADGGDNAEYTANADASVEAYGIRQEIDADGDATAVANNSGAILVDVTATANGGNYAQAYWDSFSVEDYFGYYETQAEADAWATGVYQDVEGTGTVTARGSNSGTIDVASQARAKAGRWGEDGMRPAWLDADAEASATGVDQEVEFEGTGLAEYTNSSSGDISAAAEATATAFDYGNAFADANATGIDQSVDSDDLGYGTATARATNDGDIVASAKASARAGDQYETYLYQTDTDTENEGAPIYATGYRIPVASADADVFGIEQSGQRAALIDLGATNNGSIYVTAEASAYGYAARVGGNYGPFGPQIDDYAYVTENFSLADGARGVGIYQGIYGDAFTYEGFGSDSVYWYSPQSEWASVGMATADNTGRIQVDVDAEAGATGSDVYDSYVGPYAGAVGIGIAQQISGVAEGTANADNSGDVDVTVHAWAGPGGEDPDYDDGEVGASADATAIGILQDVLAHAEASAIADNTGYIRVEGYADTTGEDFANAAVYAVGIAQIVDAGSPSTGRATATNGGIIDVRAEADASIDGEATTSEAFAYADAYGIDQWGYTPGDLYLTATNTSDGGIIVDANAYGYAGEGGYAEAEAYAAGISQLAYGGGSGSATDGLVLSASNYGYIDVESRAEVRVDDNDEFDAGRARAEAAGIVQLFDATSSATATASIANAAGGNIDVYAYADAEEEDDYYGAVDGSVFARAAGTYQDGNDSGPETFNFTWRNAGNIDVLATAEGYADEAFAMAVGAQAGHEFYDDGTTSGLVGQSLNLDYLNESTGTILVGAYAYADNDAEAVAIGQNFEADRIAGTIVNDGRIAAFAAADQDGDAASATAIGVRISGDVLDGAFTNRGVIGAIADDDGAVAQATALLITEYDPGDNGYEVGMYEGYNDFTATNDGGILVAGIVTNENSESVDGDLSSYDDLELGNAININHNTDDGPWNYGIDVQLKGTERDGFVIGDVVYNDDEQNFTVSSGRTQFLGVWGGSNPSGDDPNNYWGNIDIAGGGTFHLLNRGDQYTLDHRLPADRGVYLDLDNSVGNAMVYVDDFTVEEGGTFSVGLGPDDGTPFFGHVFANTADVEDGTLKAHFIAAYYGAGFGQRNYEDVLVADNNFGTFANIVSNTPLMQVWDEYDGTYTADIVAQRVAFDEVEGLTENQRQVAAAIEDRYDDLDDEDYNDMDDFEQMIARLFTLDGDQKYKDALDMFSAEPYAATMSNMLWSFGPLQWILADRLGGGGAGGAGPVGYAESEAASSPASDAIITGSIPSHERASLWVRPFGSWGDQKDGSSIALAHTTSQYGIYGGGDVTTGNAVLGLAGGYISSGLNFQDGSTTDYSGFQVAGYGRVDMGALYLRGVAAGGFYENKGTRVYDGGSETANAEYGSRAGSVYGEVGFNGLAMANMSLTPFAGAGYTFGSSDAFTETGTGPGNLNVDAASGSNVVTSLGAQWNTHGAIGDKPFRTSVRVAWEHRFGDGYAGLNANFANPNAPDGIGFTSTSGNWANDFAVVGASGTMDLTPATEFTLRYDGRFSADFLSNTVSGTLRQKF